MSNVLKQKSSPLNDFGTTVHGQTERLGRMRRWILRAFAVPLRAGNDDREVPDIVSSGRRWGISVPKVIVAAVLLSGLAWLMWFSLYLAASRIYQVDECCNLYVARLLAMGGTIPADLFQIFLSWLMPSASHSSDLFSSARLIMVVVFWTNWILIASATGERLLSIRWLVALAGAATLAPLWDYGFEARHDNLLLTGILTIWIIARFGAAKPQAYFFIGACALGLEFLSIKSFVYTIPISLAVLLFPRRGSKSRRRTLILFWGLGALVAFVLTRLIFNLAGVGSDYLALVKSVPAVPGSALRFAPWSITLSRLLAQTPLLLTLTAAAIVAFAFEVGRRKQATLNWDGNLPEILLVAIALAALYVNPNPYPYNLLHVVPYAFLLSFRYGADLWKVASSRPALFYPTVSAVLLFTHLIPFGIATERHLSWSNARQEGLMSLAEDVTNPKDDPVFDGSGLVPTRRVIDARSFIHGQTVRSLIEGAGPQIRDMLAANPPAVIIPSYRTDWLPEPDHAYIRDHYVELADDFWVLGKILPPGGGQFEIIHSGRYRVAALPASDLDGTYPEGWKGLVVSTNEPLLTGVLDGVSLKNRPGELGFGLHQIECASNYPVAIVWVGPNRNRLPRIGHGDHRRLFFNWY